MGWTNSSDKLTPKERTFLRLYLDETSKDTYLNKTASALRVYNTTNRFSACSIGNRIVKTKLNNETLNRIKEPLTGDYIVERLKKLANDSRRDSDKIRALELLGKTKDLCLFRESSDVKIENTVNKSHTSADIDREYKELISRRQSFNDSADKK